MHEFSGVSVRTWLQVLRLESGVVRGYIFPFVWRGLGVVCSLSMLHLGALLCGEEVRFVFLHLQKEEAVAKVVVGRVRMRL